MILATFSPAAAAAPAAAPALATPSIQKTAPGWESTMAVKDGKVSKLRPCCCSCSCYSFYSKDSSRMGKHHGSEAPAAAPALATSIQKTAPGWENTMAVKDGKVSKLRPKTP